MNSARSVVSLFGLLGALAFATVTLADDLNPPWYRGQPLSVHAQWEFRQAPANPFFITPDVFDTVAGPPQYTLFNNFATHAEEDLASNWLWVPGDGDGGITPAQGVNSASIGFKVQNWIDDLEIKYVRVQITWSGIAPVTFDLTGYEGLLAPYQPIPGQPAGTTTVDGTHFYTDWIILPNPNWEMFVINVPFGTVLDEVVIDTISIPTPASAALLTLAGAALAPRRRRA